MSIRVLIVDVDEGSISGIITSVIEVLENKKVEFDIAENGSVALMKIQENGYYNLIILDITIPYMDGIELVKLLKDTAYADPIVGFSFKDLADYKERGFTGYVRKSNYAALENVIKELNIGNW